jgi:hypothetical protein
MSIELRGKYASWVVLKQNLDFAVAAGVDEGADAEGDENQTKQERAEHGGEFQRGGGGSLVVFGPGLGHAEGDGNDGKKTDEDGGVHGVHAGGGFQGDEAADGEGEADPGGDEGGVADVAADGVGMAGEVATDADEDEEEADADSGFGHGGAKIHRKDAKEAKRKSFGQDKQDRQDEDEKREKGDD